MSSHTPGKLTTREGMIKNQHGVTIATAWCSSDSLRDSRSIPGFINAKRFVQTWNAYDELVAACRALEKAEVSYRLAHDLHGDGSPEGGRAWDNLRRCGDKARAALALADPAP